MMTYPDFSGASNEDVVDFLEKMEVACISNHVQVLAQMLHLLQMYLKGDARAWAKAYEEGLEASNPPIALEWEILKNTLVEEYIKLEDHDKVWQEIQGLVQREGEPIEDYIKKFSSLWEDMCVALHPQVPPLDMMKKDRFFAGLRENLRWRVELKKPKSYEDALGIARSK